MVTPELINSWNEPQFHDFTHGPKTAGRIAEQGRKSANIISKTSFNAYQGQPGFQAQERKSAAPANEFVSCIDQTPGDHDLEENRRPQSCTLQESNFVLLPSTHNMADSIKSMEQLQTCEDLSDDDNLDEVDADRQSQLLKQVFGNLKDTSHNAENISFNEDAQDFAEKAKNFAPLQLFDDYRCPNAHKNGGFPLNDQETMNNLRSAIKSVITQAGRTILSGQFNLANISFPIWCMAPRSILQQIAYVAGPISFNLTAAAHATYPVERMKHVMAANVAYLYPCHNWGKPLNPVLGETYQATHRDGGHVYMEQVCHHPPISYINFEGPDGIFNFSGYTEIAVRARLNSIYLDVGGHKTVRFADGTEIKFGNMQDVFGNTLMGTCHHILHGKFVFQDEKNGVTGYCNVGDVKGRPRDYLDGHIERNGQVVCEQIEGTYMGYMDFDGQRYFDVRHLEMLEQSELPLENKAPLCLRSDARHRSDLCELLEGNVEVAQQNKHVLEVDQRRDRKLREQAVKRREAGGPKIVYPHEKSQYYDL